MIDNKHLRIAFFLALPILMILFLGGLQLRPISADVPPTTVEVLSGFKQKAVTVFEEADQALRSGDFDMAREYLKRLDRSDTVSPGIHRLNDVLNNYDQLVQQLQAEQRKTYRKHLDLVREKVEHARWRESVLRASTKFDFEDEDKTELEDEQTEKIRSNWLAALSQLVATHSMAERMDLDHQVDDSLQQEIIDRCLEIARDYEKEDKGLEAYGNVYGLLGVLDEQKYQYDELFRRLSRQVELRILYVPDPNHEGVSWQERREGITIDMVRIAFASLDYAYVEKPDFQAMTERALEYCLLLADTKKLDQTFPQLADEETVREYRQQLRKKMDESRTAQFANYTDLLTKLLEVVYINQQTLKLPDNIILADFTEGAFSALDANTEIKWPADVEEFEKNIYNEFSGVGIVINKNKEGILRVDSLVSREAPAYKAGLEAGDLILAVDGKDTQNITLEKAVQLITGKTDTEVVLTARRGDAEPQDYTVNRRRVIVPTVRGICRDRQGAWQYFLDPNDGIAYLSLTHFSPESPGRLKQILRRLRKQNMRAVILDLRNNSGGLLSGAIEIADNFISSGEIVSARYHRSQKIDHHKASFLTTFDEKLPLVVLINEISASASEIVSGALKDHRRALIVGTRSYGKGSVQTIHQLPGSKAQLKMTVAYYYLPSGRRVHRDPKDKSVKDYGVEPHVNVELTGEQIENYLKVHHDAGVLHRDDLPLTEQTWQVFTPEEVLLTDPQLQVALLNLRARLLAQSNIMASRAYAAQEKTTLIKN